MKVCGKWATMSAATGEDAETHWGGKEKRKKKMHFLSSYFSDVTSR